MYDSTHYIFVMDRNSLDFITSKCMSSTALLIIPVCAQNHIFMKKFYKEGSYKIKSPWVWDDTTSLIPNCCTIAVKEYISNINLHFMCKTVGVSTFMLWLKLINFSKKSSCNPCAYFLMFAVCITVALEQCNRYLFQPLHLLLILWLWPSITFPQYIFDISEDKLLLVWEKTWWIESQQYNFICFEFLCYWSK